MEGVGKEVPQPKDVSSTPCEVLLALYRAGVYDLAQSNVSLFLEASLALPSNRTSFEMLTERIQMSSEENILELRCYIQQHIFFKN
ncbi:jg17661 [Pararge aegeria aegeria]|uniref:Jg17661 protein n=1 Tax=Pararge aegeria aegeria TaxID=348720 RepID=A0A8S4RG30_9NEOP|nr:jg17661 [Pararge aegeria aegeria]